MATAWTGWKSDPMEVPPCPRCGAGLTGQPEICPRCNLRFSQIALFDPKHWVWLGILFSFVVPSLLAALNWGRLGNRRLRGIWLIGGIAGLALLVLGSNLLDYRLGFETDMSDPVHGLLARAAAYAVNVPVALILRNKQRALFNGGRKLGMRMASTLKGTLGGIGLTLAIVIVTIGAWEMVAPLPGDDAVALMNQSRFAEAIDAFDRLLLEYPGDADLLLAKGVCHMNCEEWVEADEALTSCLGAASLKAEACVFLGCVREILGRPEEARHFFTLAEEIRPGVIEEIIGER